MTILSGQTIRRLGIMTPCHERTRHETGLTFGLGPAGYDITIKDELTLFRHASIGGGAFQLAVAQEHFDVPKNVLGRVHDKSTLARRGIQVFNTVIEPGWRGYLTLEIANHADTIQAIRAGQPIAQVVFEYLDEEAERPYEGRYQDQPLRPVPALFLAEGDEA